jgi:hypothetical protein
MLQDLLLLVRQRLVDLVDVAVVELLDLVQAAALVVLADLLVLLHLLELVVAVTPRQAHGVARVLGDVVRLLDDLLAPLLGELRHRDADDLAVARGVQAQLGLHDRPLDRRDLAGIVGLGGDQRGVRDRQVGDLVERHPVAVVIDRDSFEQRQRGAAGAQVTQLVVEMVQAVLHVRLDLPKDLLHSASSAGGRSGRASVRERAGRAGEPAAAAAAARRARWSPPALHKPPGGCCRGSSG